VLLFVTNAVLVSKRCSSALSKRRLLSCPIITDAGNLKMYNNLNRVCEDKQDFCYLILVFKVTKRVGFDVLYFRYS